MDLLAGGSDREPWRPRLPALPSLPPRLVGALGAAVLLAAVACLLPVRSAERALDRLSVTLLPVDSRRELLEAAFGGLVVVVRDAGGLPVRVDGLEVRVPGLLVGPVTGLPTTGAEVVATARFVVPDCEQLRLPGQVVLRAARPGGPGQAVRRTVARLGPVDGTDLLVVCGLAPRR